ncbi:class II glutamine amidotransferase [Parafrankia colletiae]|uniref:Class II glutamine amidotransferase n=1 Tax=Parafrankia colletiae TaxID=573497 RepID=A0A1S1QME5_9ACTN|nr:class II glutamine amidotransferase [Parafrankia colletiae]MCK9901452.1 class II glutamine amidotransferase [Frankia sp. Cpl3]OHV33504.1 class II glutamine amidotransferase [Parafrankia colletiae]
MCRLLGLTSAPTRARATFWLLDAPDSLDQQSHRNPDGTGLGVFDTAGHPDVFRAPIAAWEDRQFAAEARHCRSTTFVAHVRHASTGALEVRNTHPFSQDGRLFAHNGVIEDLDHLDAHLGPARDLVAGDTDSERFFALITAETARAGGDLGRGITAAARWVAANLPVYSINLVVTTPTELWALRYPDTNTLYLLRRQPGGHHGGRPLDHVDAAGATRLHSKDLATAASVVVASEPMDEHPDWRALRPGELVRVLPGQITTTRITLPDPPAHPLTLADLRPEAAASQTAGSHTAAARATTSQAAGADGPAAAGTGDTHPTRDAR